MLAGDNAKQCNCGKAGNEKGDDTARLLCGSARGMMRARNVGRDGYGTVKGKGGRWHRVGRWDCM